VRREAAVATTAAVATSAAVATGAAAATAATETAAAAAAAAPQAPPPPAAVPVGTVVPSLPPGCKSAVISGVNYSDCNGVFYRAGFQGNQVVYIVSQP
jgi:hypothetical protein